AGAEAGAGAGALPARIGGDDAKNRGYVAANATAQAIAHANTRARPRLWFTQGSCACFSAHA
ncbi:MAG: hypothetical protein QOH33_107, partial [Paraburkholderia sp.]|nr:hypothetical protein [Paraburkholderia sp.]